MATYNAIAATSEAIRGLLADACPSEFAGARFELYQVIDFQAPMDEGISLHLYRIAVNRSLPMQPAADGKRNRTPLPIELSYLLTPWAKTASRQQRLLGWAMRVLEDAPILPAGLLNHYVPEQETFRANETVELIAEPLSFGDMAHFWDLLKPNIPTSATYTARLVGIESSVKLIEAGLVQTPVFGLDKGPA